MRSRWSLRRSVRRWAVVALAVGSLAAVGTSGAAADTAAGAAHKSVTAPRKSVTAPHKSVVKPHTAVTLPEQHTLAGDFVASGPTRILDTRDGTGTHGVVAKLGRNTLMLDVSKVTGNPSVIPTAVVLNVTVTGATTGSHLTVYPYGQPRPITSNLNFVPGKNVANLITVPVGTAGMVAFANATGSTDVIADLEGYYTLDKAAATYVADGPARVLDTRDGTGTGGVKAPVGAGKSVSLHVTGVHGVPSSDVTAVVLNVTATAPTTAGHLTVYPSGGAVPTASNLNFGAGQTVANLVTVPVGAGGDVSFFNSAGSTQVIADLAGYYVAGAPRAGGVFRTLDGGPARVLDTRDGTGTGGVKAPVGAGKSVAVQITGFRDIPATSVTAVVLNVTATAPTTGGHLTVYPSGGSVPTASTLNFAAGQTVPNLVVVPVGAGGKVSVYNSAGSTQVVADVFGYISSGSDLTLSSLSFEAPSVDASASGAGATLDWTVADTNPDATQTGGMIVIRQEGSAPGTYVGQSYAIDFSLGQTGYGGADFVSGDAQESHYSYTFWVPQYAGAATAKWTVATVALFEATTQQRQILAGSALSGYGGTVTATEQVSTALPQYQSVELGNGVSQFTPALFDGDAGALAQFSLNIQDWQSGFSNGALTVSGPGGRTLTGSFAYQTYDGQVYGDCQHEANDADCYVYVVFPSAFPEGRWSVTSLSLTNNAGQTKDFTGLDEQPFTVTSNRTLSASGFEATPNPVNSWFQFTPFKVSMKVSGAQGGVSSIELMPDGYSQCSSGSNAPTLESDGSYSVPALMYKSNNGSPSTCGFSGYVIVDGAGHMALYGTAFGAPDPGLKVNGTPDTVAPVVTSAALSATTVTTTQLRSQLVDVIAHVTQGTAPVNGMDAELYDSTGKEVDSVFGGAGVGSNGVMTFDVPIPYDVAPGTYTVGFSVESAGGLKASYGAPGGTPVPGGPLTLTITAG